MTTILIRISGDIANDKNGMIQGMIRGLIRRMIQKAGETMVPRTVQRTMENRLAEKTIQTTKLSGFGTKVTTNPSLILKMPET